MEEKELRCTMCAFPHLEKVNDNEYKCLQCGAIVRKEKAEEFGEVFKKLQGEGKTIDISNLRYLLKKSLENEIDYDSLAKYSVEIIKILPDDLLTIFYVANTDKKYLSPYENALRALYSKATITEMNEIIDIIVSNVTNKNKDLVRKLCNHYYGDKYDSKINEILEQIKKEKRERKKNAIIVYTAMDYLDYLKKGYEDEDLKLNDPEQMNALGNCYCYGVGPCGGKTEIDFSKAFKWFKKASKHGNVDAMSSLGFLYESGKGTKQDYNKAFELYQESASKGEKFAISGLAKCYYNGNGTKQDYKKAFELF